MFCCNCQPKVEEISKTQVELLKEAIERGTLA